RPHGTLPVAHIAEGGGGGRPGEEPGRPPETDSLRELHGRDRRGLETLPVAVDIEEQVAPERRLGEGLGGVPAGHVADRGDAPLVRGQAADERARRRRHLRLGKDELRRTLAAEPGLPDRIGYRLARRR